ncbi:MAG: glycosyltransferase family 1 protein, partial [Eubacterium sp.]
RSVFASDTITKEVAVTPCWNWLSLNDAPSEWAEKIVEITERSERIDTHEMITAAGFDIKDTVKRIEAIYES